MQRLIKYDDLELLALMKSPKPDSDQAFTEFYNRYSRKVFSYCLCLLRDRDAAKDVFQDSFINFYDNPPEEHSNPSAYLFTISRNLCFNVLKRRNYKLPESDLNSVFDAVDSYEKNELFGLLMASLELLDEKYREIYVLRELNGLSFREIAEISGLTLPNAKSRFLRAKEKIIKILEPYLNDFCK